MTPPDACPHPSLLRALLDGTLPDADAAGLSAHLERCEACQKVVASLGAGGATWEELARHLADASGAPTDDEPALRRVVERAAAPGADPNAETAADAASDDTLDFLDPPREAGAIGRLARYDVLSVVGRGGMGVVLKAFDPTLRRVVAIKVMAPSLATSGAARRRFLREAQAAAAVVHDHVLAIHSVEETAKGLPFLVMPLVDGVSLQQRLDRSGPQPVAEILRVGMQVARGLAAAHAQGIVHRDVKPANILLENGVERVKLMDFGLARAVDDASLSASGLVAGTPQYMSPEQARGERVDFRSDLFSLGGVLYAMATGRPPFRAGSTPAILRRVCDDEPRPIREVNPEVPPWLAAIVARLLAKAPEERFASAAEVADHLARHLAALQQPGVTPPPSDAPTVAMTAAVRPRRRRRWFLVACGLLVLAGVVIVTPQLIHEHGRESFDPIRSLPPPAPFVVLARGDRPSTGCLSLDQAVHFATSGDTIEIRGNGTFDCQPVAIGPRALTIRAAPGAHPVLRWDPSRFPRDTPLLATTAPLILEGLELRRLPIAGEAESARSAFVPVSVTDAGSLRMANCLVSTPSLAVLAWDASEVHVRNSVIEHRSRSGIVWRFPDRGRFTLENSVASGGWSVLTAVRNPAAGGATIALRGNTLEADNLLALDARELSLSSEEPTTAPLRLILRENVLNVDAACLVTFGPQPPVSAALLRGIFTLDSDANLYPQKIPLVRGHQEVENGPREFPSVASLEEWRALWPGAEASSLQGDIRFEVGPTWRERIDLRTPTPLASYRLARNSPGAGAGEDGRDLGADVDLVGPGAAYESWKQTPEYVEWRRECDALITP